MRKRVAKMNREKQRYKQILAEYSACQERFKALVAACSDVVYRMNADWTEMHHLRGREFIADTHHATQNWMQRYLPADEHERVMAAVRAAIASKSSFYLRHRVLRADQTSGWVSSRAIPIMDADGNIKEWLGIASDISASIHCSMTHEAEHARLVETGRRKDNFLATLSHELRNPLTPISNCLEILENGDFASSKANWALEIMRRQTAHLRRITDDLLDLNRMVKNKLQVERKRVNLVQVGQEAVDSHRLQFKAADINLHLVADSNPIYVMGDATRLAQVLGNLLSNACKFTPAGGWTRMLIGKSSQNTVELHVIDSGSGIEPTLKEQLFAPFVQAQATIDRHRGGLGLGLALCKNIAELHAGTIDIVEDECPQGAHLRLRLPIATSASMHVTTQNDELAKVRRRILVIEDNGDVAESLRHMLAADGHLVEVTYDGGEGVRRGHQLQPDVVICDLGLPGLNGYAVAEKLRGEVTPKAVLIALSGYGLPANVQRAHSAGFDHHLTKPPDIARLRALIADSRGRIN